MNLSELVIGKLLIKLLLTNGRTLNFSTNKKKTLRFSFLVQCLGHESFFGKSDEMNEFLSFAVW